MTALQGNGDLSEPKRIGRPIKWPERHEGGAPVPLGLRVTVAVKRQIAEAALLSGRSMSQEASMRLEASFRNEHIEKLLNEILRRLPVAD